MDLLVMLAACAAFPVAGLGFLLWMARLEESLPQAVRRTQKQPDPPPILAIPVRPTRAADAAVVTPLATPATPTTPPTSDVPVLPTQRGAPEEVRDVAS